MKNLQFHVRQDLLEYNVVDFILDGEYAGTATIKAELMVGIANSIRRDARFDFDIKDSR